MNQVWDLDRPDKHFSRAPISIHKWKEVAQTQGKLSKYGLLLNVNT